MLVLLIIELMMFAFIIYRMLVLKKHRVPKSVLYVYGLMIIWAVCNYALTQLTPRST